MTEVKMVLPKLLAFAYSWTSKAYNKAILLLYYVIIYCIIYCIYIYLLLYCYIIILNEIPDRLQYVLISPKNSGQWVEDCHIFPSPRP